MAGLVRPARTDDAAAIARVHVDTWRSSYGGIVPDDFLGALTEDAYTARWRRAIRDGASKVYVVEEPGGVVGFASGGRERAGENGYGGELYAIYVHETAQRAGNGRELVRAVAGGLRELGHLSMIVWVLRDNARARAFYERLGGSYVRQQPLTLGGTVLPEVSYGWRRLDDIRY